MPHVIDFETFGIQPMPHYPPAPVGVSIRYHGERRSRYYAFGHPTENNCTEAEARRAFDKAWNDKEQMVFHNGLFDINVATTHWNKKEPKWSRVEDTLPLLFLYEPEAPNFSLKPSAHRVLGIVPEERDALKDWILEHIPEAKRKPSTWGAYIAHTPGKLCGAYANGDVDRTLALYEPLLNYVDEEGMMEAYRREIDMIPLVTEMERGGVRIDYERLDKDCAKWEREALRLDGWLRTKLGDLDIQNWEGEKLADALERRRLVDPKLWLLTGKGARSTSEMSLRSATKDPEVLRKLLRFRALYHNLTTFTYPWLERMEASGRMRLWPRFNSVRGRDDRAIGTRSGRFSSTDPNFQNLNRDPGDPTLPWMRRYVLPDEDDHVILQRDFDQQELRILAHYERGQLMYLYLTKADADVHDEVRIMMSRPKEDRPAVKAMNFTMIYGGGIPRIMNVLHCGEEEARTLRTEHRRALPGVDSLMKAMQREARDGEPTTTIAGRLYYPTPGKEYVQLNRRIQGSAADHTKRAMLDTRKAIKKFGARVYVQVHDEVLVSCPRDRMAGCDAAFKKAMERPYFDVPTPTDGKVGPTWGDLKAWL